jgi:truncated hemoglobin YjbI
MDPAAGNKALNDIMKQFYDKVNDNVKLALNDNI